MINVVTRFMIAMTALGLTLSVIRIAVLNRSLFPLADSLRPLILALIAGGVMSLAAVVFVYVSRRAK